MQTTALPGSHGWSQRTERVVVVSAVGVAGIVATAVTAWAVANSPILVDASRLAIWRSLFVSTFVAVGAYTWWRQPQSPLGPVVTTVGFLFAATSLNASGEPLVHTIGMVIWAAYIVFAGYAYLIFPRGRLESSLDRGFIVVFALGTAVTWGLIALFCPTLPTGGDFTNCGTACPPNALLVFDGHPELATALLTTSDITFTIGALGIAMMIFHTWRSSGRLRRRAMAPLVFVLLISVGAFVLSLFLPAAYPGTTDALTFVNGLAGVGVPLAMFAGQVRGDVFAAVRLGQIAMVGRGRALTPAEVQTLIGDALEDRTLTLALWAPEQSHYVDVDGEPLDLPHDPHSRSVTEVTREQQPFAALIHDPSIDTDSDVVQGLAATSLMLLDNARLVDQLRASRSRIVATADRERRRLERDLHDGAQQQLMMIQVKLRLAQADVEDRNMAETLEAISVEAQEAVEELRSLAHGIYPPVLRNSGLVTALRALAMRALIPIEIDDQGIGRCSPRVEAAIYFCSVEAIQNTTKHAGKHVRVILTLRRDAGTVHFVVADDGVGMDPPTQRGGDGLIGMRDRIGAVGGTLEIVSSPGQGTTVRGTVPLDEPT